MNLLATVRIDLPAFPVTIRKKRGIHVKPAPFAYKKVRSLDEAVALLGEKDARLLAGGQSLIATLNMRLWSPSLLIDINGLDGLSGISEKDGAVEVGALVRHAQAERSDVIAKRAPLIARAMPHIGHPAIRNRGTLGGSIAFADPAAELPACCWRLTVKSTQRDLKASAPSRRRISSGVCSKLHWRRKKC